MRGLSYIGMIEPGYYNAIYDEIGKQRKNVVSWHVHFLVWGVTEEHLAKHLGKNKIPLYANYAWSVRCP